MSTTEAGSPSTGSRDRTTFTGAQTMPHRYMPRSSFLRAWAIPLLLVHSAGQAQVVINEACSNNVTVLHLGDRTPDWIELHNSGAQAVDLSGHYLTDDPGRASKWRIPDMVIEAGQFVVFTSGESQGQFPFRLSSAGETLMLSDPQLEPLSKLAMPWLRADHSFGRSPVPGEGSFVFMEPTPGTINNTARYAGYAYTPVFRTAPGPYPHPIEVRMVGEEGYTVRYTTDGSEPGPDSPIADAPVTVGNTRTLKAKAFADGLIPSNTVPATYIIQESTSLPVVALSLHPDSLFHDSLGMYMPGPNASPAHPHYGANYWRTNGTPVHFEYFSADGVRRVAQELELRIHGGTGSRTLPQKPLRLTARNTYGDNRIRYPFFPERPQVTDFKRLVLRNSGSDWCLAHYRDGYFHQLAFHEGLNIDVLGFSPAVTYINGQYWGILNIRERIDEDHLALDHGANKDSLLLMEEENVSIQGDTIHFHQLEAHIHGHDLNDPVHYAHVDSLLDIPSFMDYFALQMFSSNADWPANNLKYWKPSVGSGKWRYLLYDLDATMHVAGWIPNDFDMFYWVLVHRAGLTHPEIFRSLMARHEFKRNFINRLADLMNTSLSTEHLLRENDRIRNTIRSEVERHFPRWGFPVTDWEVHSHDRIPAFARERPGHMRAHVLHWYDFPNTVELRFGSLPPDGGAIKINTIAPALPFTGTYFHGNAIDITATAAPGFVFDHWEYSTPDGGITHHAPHWQHDFHAGGSVNAVFSTATGTLATFPNPVGDLLNVVVPGTVAGPLELSLTDAQGRTVYRALHQAAAGAEHVHVPTAGLVPGMYLVTARGGHGVQHARVIKH